MTPGQPLKRSFPPVVDEGVRLLLLGSLPGEISLARQRYYANPRNQFWHLMGDVLDLDLAALPYEARLEALLAHRVGLWDTVASATREGSLDAAIRGESGNDLLALTRRLPDLRAVGFNGGKSAAMGTRQLQPRTDLSLVPLPSSSPAYTLPFEAKRNAWRSLRRFLADGSA
jgi:hypoxanthine-DNA glycosylase